MQAHCARWWPDLWRTSSLLRRFVISLPAFLARAAGVPGESCRRSWRELAPDPGAPGISTCVSVGSWTARGTGMPNHRAVTPWTARAVGCVDAVRTRGIGVHHGRRLAGTPGLAVTEAGSRTRRPASLALHLCTPSVTLVDDEQRATVRPGRNQRWKQRTST